MGSNGDVLSGQRRTLFLAGRASVDGEGAVQHASDMAGQITEAVDNMEAVLQEAGMTLAGD